MKLHTYLRIIGMALALLWLLEALTLGRGFISTYLAPVALISLIASGILRAKASKEAGDGNNRT